MLYSLIKTLFLAAIIVQLYHIYLNFILFLHTGHVNFDFNHVQYLQNVVFSFEKLRMIKITLP